MAARRTRKSTNTGKSKSSKSRNKVIAGIKDGYETLMDSHFMRKVKYTVEPLIPMLHPDRPTLIRWVLIVALLNVGLTQLLLNVRPDLDVNEPAEKLFAEARRFERKKNYDEAIVNYSIILSDMGQAALAPRAGWRLCRIYKRNKVNVVRLRETLESVSVYWASNYGRYAKDDLKWLDDHWDYEGKPLQLWFNASEKKRRAEYAEASKILAEIPKKYPDAKINPLALYHRARMLGRMDNTKDAEAAYREYLEKYPKHSRAEDAQVMLIEMEVEDGEK